MVNWPKATESFVPTGSFTTNGQCPSFLFSPGRILWLIWARELCTDDQWKDEHPGRADCRERGIWEQVHFGRTPEVSSLHRSPRWLDAEVFYSSATHMLTQAQCRKVWVQMLTVALWHTDRYRFVHILKSYHWFPPSDPLLCHQPCFFFEIFCTCVFSDVPPTKPRLNSLWM